MNKRIVILFFTGCFVLITVTAFAADRGRKIVIEGTDKSQITGSAPSDTIDASGQSKLGREVVPGGMEIGDDRRLDEGTMVKPEQKKSKREKPNMAPKRKFNIDPKVILLIALLSGVGG